MCDERLGLVEWVEFMSPGKTGEDTWISRVRIEHHADRELVAWVEREAVEGAREFAERVYAIAENDAEAMGDGQQLYMLRIYRPGEDDDKWQIRRPLRILQPFPEQGQAAEQPDHSLSRVIASSGVSPQVVREGLTASTHSHDGRPCFISEHPIPEGEPETSFSKLNPLTCLEHKPWPDGRELMCIYPALHKGPHRTADGKSWVL